MRLFRRAVFLALLIPVTALADAASELAARVYARLDAQRAVRVLVRNLSSLSPAEAAEAQRRIEQAVTRDGAKPAVEVRVTLSENSLGPLWVAEVPGHVIMVRAPATRTAVSVTLEKRFLWRQEEPILDAAVLEGGALLILSPSRLARPDLTRSVALSGARPTRDPRGRLRLDGDHWAAHLPVVVCRGTLGLESVQCGASDEPWPVGPGLDARLEPGRNYFTRPGSPPFFSAALHEGSWLFAGVDGPAISGLAGDDITTIRASCGERVLAAQENSVQAYQIAAGQAAPEGDALAMPGTITALWPLADPASVLVVVKHSRTGLYEAYRVAMACGG
jgi:hypothetical protein